MAKSGFVEGFGENLVCPKPVKLVMTGTMVFWGISSGQGALPSAPTTTRHQNSPGGSP